MSEIPTPKVPPMGVEFAAGNPIDPYGPEGHGSYEYAQAAKEYNSRLAYNKMLARGH